MSNVPIDKVSSMRCSREGEIESFKLLRKWKTRQWIDKYGELNRKAFPVAAGGISHFSSNQMIRRELMKPPCHVQLRALSPYALALAA